MLEVSIEKPKETLLCKQTSLYVRNICKGPLSATLYAYCYLENQFYAFQTTACGCLHSDVSIEYVTALVSLTE